MRREVGNDLLAGLRSFVSAAYVRGTAIVFLLAAWYILALALNMAALPTPLEAFATFFADMDDGLGYHFAISAYRVVTSIALSFFLAVPLGLVLGREPRFDRWVAPLIYLTYPVPKIVLLPVIMAIFGLNDFAKILLISLVVFFQILVTARDAAKQINRAVVDSMVSLGAGRWEIYRHVVWPASLPDIFTALRIGSGTAIAVLFFSETVGSTQGLGYYLMDGWSRYAYDEMFAGIIAMGLLGLIIYTAIDLIDKKVCTWKYL
ncbi:MAG: ABC transporter permease [Peptococcaceae bacterium]|nr:ABC transporter permease [Peptococcaceae bacterium]